MIGLVGAAVLAVSWFLQVEGGAAEEAAEGVIDVITTPGVAALTYAILGMLHNLIPERFRPPLAGAIGVGIAMLAYFSIPDAYPNALSAFGIGVTAGAAALGVTRGQQVYSNNPTPAARV